MSVMGIDPGYNGGVATININRLVILTRMPHMGDKSDHQVDVESIRFLVEANKVKRIFIEKAQAMPKQGVTSMFKYGREYGRILGMIETTGIPYELVPPRTWQKEAYKGIITKGKSRSFIACHRLYPSVSLIPEGCRVPHDGIADALLIAHYGLGR